jgi:hypothetical protein
LLSTTLTDVQSIANFSFLESRSEFDSVIISKFGWRNPVAILLRSLELSCSYPRISSCPTSPRGRQFVDAVDRVIGHLLDDAP